jgi:hypothetical protein
MIPLQSSFVTEPGLQRLFSGGEDGVGQTAGAPAGALRLGMSRPPSALLLVVLNGLHQCLEAGRIAEPEFVSREAEILDRLDRLNARGTDFGQNANEQTRPAEPANAQ